MQIIVRRCKSASNCAKITVGVLRQPVLRECQYAICARHNELQHYKIRRFARYRSMSFFDRRISRVEAINDVAMAKLSISYCGWISARVFFKCSSMTMRSTGAVSETLIKISSLRSCKRAGCAWLPAANPFPARLRIRAQTCPWLDLDLAAQ